MDFTNILIEAIEGVFFVVGWVLLEQYLIKSGKRNDNKFVTKIQSYHESKDPKTIFLFEFVSSFIFFTILSLIPILIFKAPIPILIDLLINVGLSLVCATLKVLFERSKRTQYNKNSEL